MKIIIPIISREISDYSVDYDDEDNYDDVEGGEGGDDDEEVKKSFEVGVSRLFDCDPHEWMEAPAWR